jgi:hypothetical protein
MKELSVIQKTYDCIRWYVPIIERLPKIHKFTLGQECNRRVQPAPVMLVTVSKNQTGLGSLVGVNRTVAQLSTKNIIPPPETAVLFKNNYLTVVHLLINQI